MLTTESPLQEKMALFWHGHYAISEGKVRITESYSKNWSSSMPREPVISKSSCWRWRRIPQCCAFLDAGVNVKGAPNENFAREIMELFTMGVGNYGEQDIREAARAFTGWNYVDLQFAFNEHEHDDGRKEFLGRSGEFDGEDIIAMIMEQPATAEYIAGKIYRFFVRTELSTELQGELGSVLREADYEIATLLETIFLSKDFYSDASVGTHIKSPVELAISTYKKLGLTAYPVFQILIVQPVRSVRLCSDRQL